MPLYSPLTLDDLSKILKPYDCEPISHAHLSAGVENTNYRVRTRGRLQDVVLTVLENRDLSSAEAYAGLLVRLHTSGIPMPRIWRRRDGGHVSVHRGKPVIVSDHISGHCHDVLPPEFLPVAGRALASVHAHSSTDFLPDPVVRLGESDLQHIDSFSDSSFSSWLLEWHDKVCYVTEDDSLPRGLTHGDLFADNMIVTPRRDVVVLDWENAANDYHVLDLGMAVLGLTGVGAIFDANRARLLLEGYLSKRVARLSPDRLLESIIYAAVFTAYHRYLKHEIADRASGKQGYYREIPTFVDSLIARWSAVF